MRSRLAIAAIVHALKTSCPSFSSYREPIADQRENYEAHQAYEAAKAHYEPDPWVG